MVSTVVHNFNSAMLVLPTAKCSDDAVLTEAMQTLQRNVCMFATQCEN